MSSPRISIIVPVYNVESYLSQCLDSLIGQTLKDIEIVCVDDGSTDGSPGILRDYAAKDGRIKIVTKENGGLSSARNAGLAVASSELVTFVDSDDYVLPEAYEIAVDKMTGDIDYVCFGIKTFGHPSEAIRKSDECYYTIRYEGKVKVTESVMQMTDVSSCNKIFRKSFITQYDIYYPEGLRYEDAYFFNIYGVRSQYAYYIQDYFYHYIRRDNSIMGETFKGNASFTLDHLRIAIRIYEYLKKHGLLEEHMEFFGKTFFSLMGCAIKYEASRRGKREVRKFALRFLKNEDIDFAAYPALSATYLSLLDGREPDRIICKYLGGLVEVQKDPQRIKYYFCGIPMMRIKIRDGVRKYYLFSMFPVWHKREYHEKNSHHVESRLGISVILPVYQAEKEIAYTLSSILSQTFRDFECIIINDACTDATREIIASYKDSRIRLIDNTIHAGEKESYRQGLGVAQGDYVILGRTDEISLCDRFARQFHYLKLHDEVDGVSGRIIPGLEGISATNYRDASCMMRRSVAQLLIEAGDKEDGGSSVVRIEDLGIDLICRK